jgi:hypothetical protein
MLVQKKFNKSLRADSRFKFFKSTDVSESDSVSIISMKPDDGDGVGL